MNKSKSISLPCLRGRMGDWFYYVTLISFGEVSSRVKLPKEIDSIYDDENLKLGDWIQRDLKKKRIAEIVSYLTSQDQRFFNSLILGVYEGAPQWREIEFQEPEKYYNEEQIINFNQTFGVLSLSGEELIFAIDGQHRANSIKQACKQDPSLKKDEICAIFVAHKTDLEGKERTRRLFTTLNKYAKPVNRKEIIALSEDDNCAILTRRLVENFDLFKNRILISGNKSVSRGAVDYFTSIITLYEIVVAFFTNNSVAGYKSSEYSTVGYNYKDFTEIRESDEIINSCFSEITSFFTEIISEIPSLKNFFIDMNEVQRDDLSTSLLFRPIGQSVLLNVFKAAKIEGKYDDFLNFFKQDNFNLHHPVWKIVFWDSETETIIPDKSRQRFASLLIMEKLGFSIRRTQKDLETLTNFNVSSSDI